MINCVVKNGQIIHAGEWRQIDAESRFPEGAVQEMREVLITEKGKMVLASDYASLRADAYPSVVAQLDMQYHDLQDGGTRWLDAVAAVKVRFPKPGA